jgi:four helix bundle protein
MHKSDKILEDMADLSVQVIKYVELKRIPFAIKDQLIRTVSSVGASYTEAQTAPSKRLFLSNVYDAKKEAREARYWLGIVERLDGQNEETLRLKRDVNGFYMMMQKIINTTKETARTRASKTAATAPATN